MPMMSCNPFTIRISMQYTWCPLAHGRQLGVWAHHYLHALPSCLMFLFLVSDHVHQFCRDKERAHWWGFTEVRGIC